MVFNQIYGIQPYIWYMSEYMYTDIYMVEKPNIYTYMSETQNKCYVEPLVCGTSAISV